MTKEAKLWTAFAIVLSSLFVAALMTILQRDPAPIRSVASPRPNSPASAPVHPQPSAVAPAVPMMAQAAPRRVRQPRVIFVCDTTGSMTDKLAFAKAEILKAVASLKPGAMFNVVFVGEDGKADPFRPEMVEASAAESAALNDRMTPIKADGSGDPLIAMMQALEERPDVIWLVSDGDFANNNALLEGLKAANSTARINTLVISTDRDTSESRRALMARIAYDHRGVCRDEQGAVVEPPGVGGAGVAPSGSTVLRE
jgi:hypothetical protein